MALKFTNIFIETATAAGEILKKETHTKNIHAFDMCNWFGHGTIELHLVPPSRKSWLRHKASYDKFWEALRQADLLGDEPKEDNIWLAKRGHVFSHSALIHKQTYIPETES